jgi:hypothetical protein
MVKFIYTSGHRDVSRENLIIKIFTIAKRFIELPDSIEVQFKNMPLSVYAETLVNTRHKNRICLNDSVPVPDVMYPTIHELLHLNQIHTNRLSALHKNIYLWEGQKYSINVDDLSYEDYRNLPWEEDVFIRERKLLISILNFKD